MASSPSPSPDSAVSAPTTEEKKYISDEEILQLKHFYLDPVSGAWMPHPDYASALLLTREYQEAIYDDTNVAFNRLKQKIDEELREQMDRLEQMAACEDPVECLKTFHGYTDEDVEQLHARFDQELDISMANADRNKDRGAWDRCTSSH